MALALSRLARCALAGCLLAVALPGAVQAQLLSPPAPRGSGTITEPAVASPAAPTRPNLLTPLGPAPARSAVETAVAAPSYREADASRSPAADVSRSPLVASADRAPPSSAGLRVSKGTGVLPNEHGQVWREYDISSYTNGAEGDRPEQRIIDWVLRETGTEVWFSEPLGILSANSTTLRVYHTPKMQDAVRGVVERFVAAGAATQAVGIRLMTIGSPDWRSQALSLLKPVDVKSPGVEAWLVSRENAALLLEQLQSRGDFREHSAPQVEIASGQSQALARTEPRPYTKSVQLKREYPFYDLVPGKIEEGYSLEISPLVSLDGQSIEAALTCRIDQVEKLVPLAIDVPIGPAQSQRVQIQVPQVVSWRLSERFRWPTSEVLLLSCGVVASPAGAAGPLSFLSPLGIGKTGRADALLMIDCREKAVR